MNGKSAGKSGTKAMKSMASEAMKAGSPPQQQDTKRRLGNFVGAGEHARQGGRTTGIVGQTKQRNKTDKKSK